MATESRVKDGLVDEKVVAEYLGVSLGTVRRWRVDKKGPVYFKFGYRIVRYRVADVQAYLQARQVGSRA